MSASLTMLKGRMPTVVGPLSLRFCTILADLQDMQSSGTPTISTTTVTINHSRSCDVIHLFPDRHFFAIIVVRREKTQILHQLLSSKTPLIPLSTWLDLALSIRPSQKILLFLLGGAYTLCDVPFPAGDSGKALKRLLRPGAASGKLRRLFLQPTHSVLHSSWLAAAIEEKDVQMTSAHKHVPQCGQFDRILRRPGIGFPKDFHEQLISRYQRYRRNNTERDAFIVQFLWDIIRKRIASPPLMIAYEIYPEIVIRTEDTSLLEECLRVPTLSRISTTLWLSAAVHSLKMSTHLVEVFPENSDGLFNAVKRHSGHPGVMYLIAQRYPKASFYLAGWGFPSCFEFVDQRNKEWIRSIIVTAILSNVRYSNEKMEEKLLSPEILLLSHSLHHLLLAEQLTIDDLAFIFASTKARKFEFERASNILAEENISLLDLADCGCIELFKPIIEEGTKTTHYNNSMLHAMWFSAGAKNEAILEAIRAGKEDMVQILCESGKIDVRVNGIQVGKAVIESKSPRINAMYQLANRYHAYIDGCGVISNIETGHTRCFENIDHRDVEWMRKIIATTITTNVQEMLPEMREKLLSAEITPFCYNFQMLIIATRAKFRELAELIAPQLTARITYESTADEGTDDNRAVGHHLQSSRAMAILLDFAECGWTIELLQPIIQAGPKTTFNNSILHAVVRSGRTDLLRLMDRKMWFSSGEKNEALLEAIGGRKEEMVEILCRSKTINLSVNWEEIEPAALSSKSDRIIEIISIEGDLSRKSQCLGCLRASLSYAYPAVCA
ncbi:hypothetical protein PROFUN_07368 [Planoprotostelium fungivorum]|uniref:Uncharacterized protein n=1 Tax=Planoprotostelium fungivorum TaxID=1890364 RepID=A0A2P6NM22_9EUKA|nr:hypothetical protein PROFUN_07368 [Planoprotostelium fungivorum]